MTASAENSTFAPFAPSADTLMSQYALPGAPPPQGVSAPEATIPEIAPEVSRPTAHTSVDESDTSVGAIGTSCVSGEEPQLDPHSPTWVEDGVALAEQWKREVLAGLGILLLDNTVVSTVRFHENDATARRQLAQKLNTWEAKSGMTGPTNFWSQELPAGYLQAYTSRYGSIVKWAAMRHLPYRGTRWSTVTTTSGLPYQGMR